MNASEVKNNDEEEVNTMKNYIVKTKIGTEVKVMEDIAARPQPYSECWLGRRCMGPSRDSQITTQSLKKGVTIGTHLHTYITSLKKGITIGTHLHTYMTSLKKGVTIGTHLDTYIM